MKPLNVPHQGVQRLMNWLNSRTEEQSSIFTASACRRAIQLSTRRSPTHSFGRCVATGGVLDAILDIQTGGDRAVDVMLRRTNQVKRVYVAATESVDFAGFDFKAWTIVVFYNPDGVPSMFRGQETIKPAGTPFDFSAPPVGGDDDMRVDDEDMLETPLPRGDETPAYSGPDTLVSHEKERSRSRDAPRRTETGENDHVDETMMTILMLGGDNSGRDQEMVRRRCHLQTHRR
jgi:hypothetical protein